MQGWEQYFFVNRRTMHAMCSQAPAVFELLPDPSRPEVWPLDRRPPQCFVFRKERPAAAEGGNVEEVESEGAEVGGEGVHVQLKDSISEHGNVVRKDVYSMSDFRTALEGSLAEFEVWQHAPRPRPLSGHSHAMLCIIVHCSPFSALHDVWQNLLAEPAVSVPENMV